MGIADRDYARAKPSGRPRGMGSIAFWSVNTWLLAINILVFVVTVSFRSNGVPVLHGIDLDTPTANPMIVGGPGEFWGSNGAKVPAEYQRRVGTTFLRPVVDANTKAPVGRAVYRVMDPLSAFGHFSTAVGFQRIEVWRLITFQFLHANILHLFFNMFGLWIFGGTVEHALGRKRYLAFYLVCGIFGAIFYLMLNFLGAVAGLRLPGVLFHDTHVPLVGASAGVFGVIVACAALAPREMVRLIFPPIALELRWFAYVYVAIAAFNLLAGGPNAGGDAAHLGGAAAGAFFIRRSYLLRDFFDVLGDSRLKSPTRAPGAEERARYESLRQRVRERGLADLSPEDRELFQRHHS